MKSSRDIPPRVGMQLAYLHELNRISSMTANRIITDRGHVFVRDGGQHSLWLDGHLEITWTPPTNDERRLFMEAADDLFLPDHECGGELCEWLFAHGGNADDRVVLESLALDGADYDNMPDFEELER